MGLADVQASIDAHNRDIVESQTWGHLAPALGKAYRGSITFACASYGGDVAILSLEFARPDGTPLNDNPWSYEDLSNYIIDWVCDQANGYHGCEKIAKPMQTDGKVFTFTGSYTRFKNNSCRIAGTVRERRIV